MTCLSAEVTFEEAKEFGAKVISALGFENQQSTMGSYGASSSDIALIEQKMEKPVDGILSVNVSVHLNRSTSKQRYGISLKVSLNSLFFNFKSRTFIVYSIDEAITKIAACKQKIIDGASAKASAQVDILNESLKLEKQLNEELQLCDKLKCLTESVEITPVSSRVACTVIFQLKSGDREMAIYSNEGKFNYNGFTRSSRMLTLIQLISIFEVIMNSEKAE